MLSPQSRNLVICTSAIFLALAAGLLAFAFRGKEVKESAGKIRYVFSDGLTLELVAVGHGPATIDWESNATWSPNGSRNYLQQFSSGPTAGTLSAEITYAFRVTGIRDCTSCRSKFVFESTTGLVQLTDFLSYQDATESECRIAVTLPSRVGFSSLLENSGPDLLIRYGETVPQVLTTLTLAANTDDMFTLFGCGFRLRRNNGANSGGNSVSISRMNADGMTPMIPVGATLALRIKGENGSGLIPSSMRYDDIGGLVEAILHAVRNEAGSNVWKLWVMSV